MLRAIVVFYSVVICLNPTFAAINHLQALISNPQPIAQNQLPAPFNQLLTQPLMTETLAGYYKTKPIIKTLDAYQDQIRHHFYRVILMLDNRNPKIPRIIELGFIQINLNELPPEMIQELLSTNIPFGQLLRDHKIKIDTKDRQYFTLICSKKLEELTHCQIDTTLYARRNTIVSAANGQWIAKVIEVLPTYFRPNSN